MSLMTSTIHNDPSVSESVSAFADSAESLSNLCLVKAVVDTVDALCDQSKFYISHAVTGRTLISKIKDVTPQEGRFLDPEGSAEESLDEMISRSEAELSLLTSKKGSIDEDRNLSSAHCDMLHTSYDDVLIALARLIEVAKDMRAALITHDLAAEPRAGRTYPSIAELRTAILH